MNFIVYLCVPDSRNDLKQPSDSNHAQSFAGAEKGRGDSSENQSHAARSAQPAESESECVVEFTGLDVWSSACMLILESLIN